MITEHDLQEAIAECEGQRNPSANTCLKLAAFYTIKDKMYPSEPETAYPAEPVAYSRAAGPEVAYASDTEFGRAVAGMDQAQLISVMDELMTTVQAILPKLYDGVMRKLTER